MIAGSPSLSFIKDSGAYVEDLDLPEADSEPESSVTPEEEASKSPSFPTKASKLSAISSAEELGGGMHM